MKIGVLLGLYCLLITVASLFGGWLPMIVRLTHRRMQVALSFVSGVMLGIAMLHLLPHAIMTRAHTLGPQGHVEHDHEHVHLEADATLTAPEIVTHGLIDPLLLWLLAGFLVMFFTERFFCFHHHEVPDDEEAGPGGCEHGHHHHHLRWSGATIGLTLHTLVAGIALAASVQGEWGAGRALAGFGTFLVIVLHKPFDALTIGTLMSAGRHGPRAKHLVNVLFSLVVPVGVALFFLGLSGAAAPDQFVAAALAFSAGTFLCIALSDLLPELQFHQHDRTALSIALLLGLGLAWAVASLERTPVTDNRPTLAP